MQPSEFRSWVLFAIAVLTPIITAAVTWTKLTTRVNGLGGRVKKIEEQQANTIGRQDAAERQLAEVRAVATDVHARLGKVEGRVEGVDAHITEFKLELFQKLSDMQQITSAEQTETRLTFLEKNAMLRERIARLEERRGFPHEERHDPTA